MIPPQLQPAGFRFIKLRKGDKIPIEKDWQNTNNYAFDDQALINHFSSGGNYGVACGFSGLVVLDVDDVKRFKSHADHKKLPPTFTVKTGSGGFHFYFVCEDLDRKIVLEDSTGHHLGEIQSTGAQVVGPGCLHPNGNRYEVVNDVPIAPISKADLLSALNYDVLKEIEKAARRGRKTATGNDPFDNVSILDVIDTTGFEQCGDQLKGPHPIHGSTGGVNLVVNPAKNSWWCGRHETGGGVALWLAVEAGLIDCSEARPGALRGELFGNVLNIAQERGLIGGRSSTRENTLEILQNFPNKYDEDPDILTRPDVKAALADLQKRDPLKFELLLKTAKIRGGVRNALLADLKQILRSVDDEEDEIDQVPPEIKQKAQEIAEHGDPVKYILDVLEKHHAGDRRSAELLLCSAAIGSILNVNGTQPKLSGGSGKGKTHLCKALRHLIPTDWIFYTSLSPKALYRATLPDSPIGIKPGMIIFSDDVRINEDMEDTMKRSMSNFQEQSRYLVVGKDGVLLDMHLPERLIWWLTSVNDDQEEQLINRFFQVGVDESPQQDLKSLNLTFASLAEGRAEFPITEEVLICREIIRGFKEKVWMAWAPFLKTGESLNVEWANPEERRNPGRFADLLAAYAVLRHAQRETTDEDGYTKVMATENDFIDAKALYESRAENLTTKMTDTELHFVRWLKTKANNAPFHFKINDAVKEYKGPNKKGLSTKTLERMLMGRKDRNTYGLIDKIKGGGLIEETKSETIDVDGDRTHKRQNRYKLFTFDPAKFDILGSYSGVVNLKNPQQARERPKKTQPDPSLGSSPADPLDVGIEDKEDNNTQNTQNTQGVKNKHTCGRNPKNKKNKLGLYSGSSGSSGSVGELVSGPINRGVGSAGSFPGECGANTAKIEMPTPTWRDEIRRVTKKHGGRVTADDLIRECGWKPEVVRRRLGYLHEKEGWTSEKLVSGLLIFREPTEVA